MRGGRVSDPVGDDEEDELPERIIVVREPLDADPDEAAASAAEDEHEATLTPEDTDVAEELPGWEPVATDDASREQAIDLDEVDLRFEPAEAEDAAVEVD